MKYFLMLIPIFLAFTAGCESMQTETYGDYTPVISEHDPARDFRNDENGRMGFIVSEEADSRISPAELDSIMSESFMAANTYGLKYLEASALTCAANASGLGARGQAFIRT